MSASSARCCSPRRATTGRRHQLPAQDRAAAAVRAASGPCSPASTTSWSGRATRRRSRRCCAGWPTTTTSRSPVRAQGRPRPTPTSRCGAARQLLGPGSRGGPAAGTRFAGHRRLARPRRRPGGEIPRPARTASSSKAPAPAGTTRRRAVRGGSTPTASRSTTTVTSSTSPPSPRSACRSGWPARTGPRRGCAARARPARPASRSAPRSRSAPSPGSPTRSSGRSSARWPTDVQVLADWRVSPTGFPFKVVQSRRHVVRRGGRAPARQPVCDLGVLRTPYRKRRRRHRLPLPGRADPGLRRTQGRTRRQHRRPPLRVQRADGDRRVSPAPTQRQRRTGARHRRHRLHRRRRADRRHRPAGQDFYPAAPSSTTSAGRRPWAPRGPDEPVRAYGCAGRGAFRCGPGGLRALSG